MTGEVAKNEKVRASPGAPPTAKEIAAQRTARVGQVLLGKLRVVRHIGGGGMGDVYEVEHMLTHHRRALKILRPELAKQPRYVERLLREASIAGRLQTPYVAETLDAGRLEDGSAYVLMELLHGRSLHDVLELDPRLAQSRVANILAQVAEGMAVAHAAGIVHRDLKPENVFLVGEERDDRVKILDFGISKIEGPLTEGASRLTREGTLVGTPFYMAPEQAAGREVDARVDVWAMGVIAYEALTGKVPFNGSTVGEVMMLIGAGMYPPVTTRRPDVEPAFAAVIDRALRPDLRDRYASAEAFRRDLLPFATNESAARARTISDGARSVPPRAQPLPAPPALPSIPEATSSPSHPSGPAIPAAMSSDTGERAARERTVGPVVLGIVAVVAIGLTVWLSTSRPTGIEGHRPMSPAASPPPASATTTATTTAALPPEATTVAALPPTSPPPSAVAEIDAGAIAAPRPPPTSRSVRTPRTPAEAAGLEGNPYGTP